MSKFKSFCEGQKVAAKIIETGDDEHTSSQAEKITGLALMAAGTAGAIVGAIVPGAQFGLVMAPGFVITGAAVFKWGNTNPIVDQLIDRQRKPKTSNKSVKP